MDPITTVEELRAVIAPPSDVVTDKETDALDHHCREFIAQSPFVLIASSDGRGSIDISPKGDPPGFVQVLDQRTLAIPDRPGNHRADTFLNIVAHPFVGMLFLVPGSRITLRVRGRATIAADHDLRVSMAIDGKVPDLAMVVELTTAYFHCAKCIIRSELWSVDAPDGPMTDARLLAEAMVAHGDLPISVDRMQQIVLADEQGRLY